jgi:hypothetical protein
MPADPITRRRKIRLTVAVLAVAILVSALVALALIYMATPHPGS